MPAVCGFPSGSVVLPSWDPGPPSRVVDMAAIDLDDAEIDFRPDVSALVFDSTDMSAMELASIVSYTGVPASIDANAVELASIGAEAVVRASIDALAVELASIGALLSEFGCNGLGYCALGLLRAAGRDCCGSR